MDSASRSRDSLRASEGPGVRLSIVMRRARYEGCKARTSGATVAEERASWEDGIFGDVMEMCWFERLKYSCDLCTCTVLQEFFFPSTSMTSMDFTCAYSVHVHVGRLVEWTCSGPEPQVRSSLPTVLIGTKRNDSFREDFPLSCDQERTPSRLRQGSRIPSK